MAWLDAMHVASHHLIVFERRKQWLNLSKPSDLSKLFSFDSNWSSKDCVRLDHLNVESDRTWIINDLDQKDEKQIDDFMPTTTITSSSKDIDQDINSNRNYFSFLFFWFTNLTSSTITNNNNNNWLKMEFVFPIWKTNCLHIWQLFIYLIYDGIRSIIGIIPWILIKYQYRCFFLKYLFIECAKFGYNRQLMSFEIDNNSLLKIRDGYWIVDHDVPINQNKNKVCLFFLY